MPTYTVCVADKDTGEETALSIDADTPDGARDRANDLGWLVSDVNTGPRPKQARSQASAASAPSIAIGVFGGLVLFTLLISFLVFVRFLLA